MFATNFIPIRDQAEEIELIFSPATPKINFTNIKHIISSFGPNDPDLETALTEPWKGNLDGWGYPSIREYILNEILGAAEEHFGDPSYVGYSYKRFVDPAGDVTYRFWSDHGVGDDECGRLLDVMCCLLAIPGVYEASSATSFITR